MFFNLLLLLPVIPTSLALPFIERSSYSHLSHKFDLSKFQGCPTSGILVPVPMGLSVPNGQTTSLVTVGRGIQNYTCTNGAYVTAGALANLYDVSCLFDAVDDFIAPSEVPKVLPEIAYSSLPYPDTYGLPVTIHHLFIDTPGSTTAGAISPEFVGELDKVVTSKTASVKAPDSTDDIDWLQLTAVPGHGNLSKSVFRLDTVKGQPPASCSTEGATLSVQYAAMYFFTE